MSAKLWRDLALAAVVAATNDDRSPRTKDRGRDQRNGGFGAGHHRRALPIRIAPRAGNAHPAARRFRPRRGSAARRVRGGRRAVAARRCAGQPARVAGVDWPLQGHRSACADGAVRRRARPSSPRRLDRRSPASRGVRDEDARGRPSPVDLHVLPSGACRPDAQVALTLREVCGLTTEEIARAFLTPAPDVARSGSSARRTRFATRTFRIEVPSRDDLARAARRRATRRLSRLQRRLLGIVGAIADAPRPVGEAIRLAGSSSSCCRSRKRSDCWR